MLLVINNKAACTNCGTLYREPRSHLCKPCIDTQNEIAEGLTDDKQSSVPTAFECGVSFVFAVTFSLWLQFCVKPMLSALGVQVSR